MVKCLTGAVDLDTDTIKLSLHSTTYTPNQDTHDFFNDASTSQLATGNGYSTGGVTLGSKTVALDTGSDQIRFDAANASWTLTSTGIAWRYAVIYKSRGGASSADELIGYIDPGAKQTPVAGTYTFNFSTAGILYVDVT